MNRIATLLIGSALTALIACPAFAADPAPAGSSVSKPAETTATPPASAIKLPAAVAAPAPVVSELAKEPAVKLGYVDMSKIAADSEVGKAAQAALKERSDKLRAKIQARQKQIEKQKKDIEAKFPGLTPKERAAKAKEFEKKMDDYRKLVTSSEEEMQVVQEKATSELYRTIKKTAASYAKSHGYSVVMEQKAVLYISENMEPAELTAAITALLNEQQGAK